MEEETLKDSIATYRAQLEQVEQTLQAAGETEDLVTLRNDLLELIKLTEDSLLSLKKSQLLKQLDDTEDWGHSDQRSQGQGHVIVHANTSSTNANVEMDDEYASFQAILSADVTTTINVNSSLDSSQNGHLNCENISAIYKDIIGTKCRAPYIHDWGEKSVGNALIVSIETETDLDIPKVRVMFCNPTHISMLPCKYYLEGSCKFSQDKCKFSHGHIVELEDLQEYQDPDYSHLVLGCKCVARYEEDDIWYTATVVDIGETTVTVMYHTYEDEAVTLPLGDILPTESSEDSSDTENDDVTINQPISREDSDDDDTLPVFLWKPPSHGLGDLGQWEVHTKGIGSKLMTQMGYIPGQGLGKNGEGRIQPVPIQLLPQGKSLDKIMRLKALAGERDLFDVMKKEEKKKKKQAEKLAKDYQQTKPKPNMFDFINKKLGGKKGKLSELVHKHEGQGHLEGHKDQGKIHRTISENDLKKKSDRNINIQLLKTSEEMKSVQKELVKLKQSLSRNENRDRTMATKVRDKIQSMETYLNKLKSSEETMNNHQQKRSDHKKLTVF